MCMGSILCSILRVNRLILDQTSRNGTTIKSGWASIYNFFLSKRIYYYTHFAQKAANAQTQNDFTQEMEIDKSY